MARKRKTPMTPQQAIGRGLTRQARTPSTSQNIRAMEGRYGRADAARRAGVSDRTWRRWRAGGQPSRANAAKLADEAREARVNPRREKRLRNRGAYVRMTAKVGGGTPGARRKNSRTRTIGEAGFESVHLSGDQMGDILDQWEAGNDAGALDALRDAIRDTPWGSSFGNFEFDDISSLEFLRDDPNG
jgi:hypothetical protein